MMGNIIPRQEWINLTNYQVWRLLKVLQASKKACVREILSKAGGSPNTNLAYLYSLERWNLVKHKKAKRNKLVFSITPLGRKVLKYYDGIGEIVKHIRNTH
jgi:predicted transcriptional regulator